MVFKKVFQQGRNKRSCEAYGLRYVERLRDVRTQLEAFFNTMLRPLQEASGPPGPQ